METWKPIDGFTELYEVSNLGRVRSKPRFSIRKNRMYAGRILAPSDSGNGYCVVRLCCAGSSEKRYIHRLVLEAFAGPSPAGTEACHCNGNRSDNRLENLRWDTRQANVDDTRAHGNIPVGSRKTQSKLTEADVIAIRVGSLMGKTQRALAKRFGVQWQTIGKIIRRESWRHLP